MTGPGGKEAALKSGRLSFQIPVSFPRTQKREQGMASVAGILADTSSLLDAMHNKDGACDGVGYSDHSLHVQAVQGRTVGRPCIPSEYFL